MSDLLELSPMFSTRELYVAVRETVQSPLSTQADFEAAAALLIELARDKRGTLRIVRKVLKSIPLQPSHATYIAFVLLASFDPKPLFKVISENYSEFDGVSPLDPELIGDLYMAARNDEWILPRY